MGGGIVVGRVWGRYSRGGEGVGRGIVGGRVWGRYSRGDGVGEV